MNAIASDADFPFDHAVFHGLEPGILDSTRHDGWTAEKQKRFLVALSLGHPIIRLIAPHAAPRVSPAEYTRPAGSSVVAPPRTRSSAAAR